MKKIKQIKKLLKFNLIRNLLIQLVVIKRIQYFKRIMLKFREIKYFARNK